MGSSPTASTMAITWSRRSYTEDEFRTAWSESRSIAQCASKLGLTIYGSTYSTMKTTASELGLDTAHMSGQSWNLGKVGSNLGKPIESYLKADTRTNSGLKRRLIKEGYLVEKCSAPFCPVPNPSVNPFTGESTPLKLALDHINGDNRDNRIENLRLLCYHCHGETDTWTSKNRKTPKSISTPLHLVCKCGNSKGKTAKTCRRCADAARRKSS